MLAHLVCRSWIFYHNFHTKAMQELFSSQKQLLTIVFDSDTINSTNKIAKEDAAFSQTVPERNAKLGCKRFTAEKDDTTSESA